MLILNINICIIEFLLKVVDDKNVKLCFRSFWSYEFKWFIWFKSASSLEACHIQRGLFDTNFQHLEKLKYPGCCSIAKYTLWILQYKYRLDSDAHNVDNACKHDTVKIEINFQINIRLFNLKLGLNWEIKTHLSIQNILWHTKRHWSIVGHRSVTKHETMTTICPIFSLIKFFTACKSSFFP